MRAPAGRSRTGRRTAVFAADRRGLTYCRGVTTRPALVSASLVALYCRPDAFYVVASDRTTAGVWLHSGPAERVSNDVGPQALADVVAVAVEPDARVVRHPAPDEWTQWQRQALRPLLRQAGVRSWTAFVAPAGLVTVHRHGIGCTVTPERRDQRQVDAFYPMTEDEIELPDCTPDRLSHALVAAIEATAR